MLLRATTLSKLGYLADAINDLNTAHLMMPTNHTITHSLLRLYQSDLQNYQAIFTQTLIYLLRLAPSFSLNNEVMALLSATQLMAMGAAWQQDDSIIGWAVSKHEPDANLLIELDGGFFSVKTGLPTPALAEAGIGNGYNGFCLKLPDTYHLLRLGIAGTSLWGCPFIGNALATTQESKRLVTNRVDIIVPVYAGLTDTLACLDAIKASRNTISYRVIVVDDCSPDVLLVNALKERAQRNEITLLCRPINAGFSGAINTALAFDRSRDVVLLNADTLVFGNWLDRLYAAAYESDDIATVTPLSNHGELVSYPQAMTNNPVYDSKQAEFIDQVISTYGSQRPFDIPSGVGFCFYIKRHALSKVGWFDEATFGRGYGEDTDFCLRIQQAGLRNVCAANTYVVHWGSRSFGKEKKYLVKQNLPRLHLKYPKHSEEYDQFLANNPLNDLCRGIQRHLLAKLMPQYKATLHLSALKSEGDGAFILNPMRMHSGQWLLSLNFTGITGLDAISYHWPEQAEELRADILAAGFKKINLKTLGDWPLALIDQLADGFIPYDISFEDYSGYCPRKYRLVDHAVKCNDPLDINACTRCVEALGPRVYDYADIVSWQARTERLLSKAKKVSVLNNELRNAYKRHFPTFTKSIALNNLQQKLPATLKLSINLKQQVRIAVLKASSLDDGYLQLIEQANKALQHGLIIEFVVFGKTLNNSKLQSYPNIYLVGVVKKDQIEQVLRLHDCKAIANFSPCAHSRLAVNKAAEQFNLPLIFDCNAT